MKKIENKKIDAYIISTMDLENSKPLEIYGLVSEDRIVSLGLTRNATASQECTLMTIKSILSWITVNTIGCSIHIHMQGNHSVRHFTDILINGKDPKGLSDDETELLQDARALVTDKTSFIVVPQQESKSSGYITYLRQVLHETMKLEREEQQYSREDLAHFWYW